ncbi:hypothetical protein Tco_1450631 [Tanacetum coccineum]
MVDNKAASTPFEPPKLKDNSSSDAAVNVHYYRSMIGSLMYLTASRPDIMFAVSACARNQVSPTTSNLLAVKRIFKYLKAFPKLGLWYPRDSPFHLEAFSDSDYAGAAGDRKSTTGGCQYLGRRLISWQCKKQTIVATSSCEAEYVAAASCCGQAIPSDTTSLRRSGRKKTFARNKTTSSATTPSLTYYYIEEGDPDAEYKQYLRYASDEDVPSVDFSQDVGSDLAHWEVLSTDFGLGEIHLVRWADGSERQPSSKIPSIFHLFNHSTNGGSEILCGTQQGSVSRKDKEKEESLVRQFWATASEVSLPDGTVGIEATIDGHAHTITKASIRSSLRLNDQGATVCLPTDDIYSGLAAIGYVPDQGVWRLCFFKNKFSPQWKFLVHTLIHCIDSKVGSWNQIGSHMASALLCLANRRPYNFSSLIFQSMVSNITGTKKFLMYPRFIQMILNVQTTDTTSLPSNALTAKLFANMRNFQGTVMPLLPSMLHIVDENVGQSSQEVPLGEGALHRHNKWFSTHHVSLKRKS